MELKRAARVESKPERLTPVELAIIKIGGGIKKTRQAARKIGASHTALYNWRRLGVVPERAPGAVLDLMVALSGIPKEVLTGRVVFENSSTKGKS